MFLPARTLPVFCQYTISAYFLTVLLCLCVGSSHVPALCLCSTYVHQLSTSARAFCFRFSCQHSVSCLCSLICQLFACVPAFSELVLQHCLPALCQRFQRCPPVYKLVSTRPCQLFCHFCRPVLAFSVNLPVFNQQFSRICQRSRRLYLLSNHGSLPALRQRLHQFNSTLQLGILHQQAFLRASTSVQTLLMLFFV